MKIPQYRFLHFPSTDGGTWWLTADFRKPSRFNGIATNGVQPSPVPTVALLSILSLDRGGA
jgi:hypothetical protein